MRARRSHPPPILSHLSHTREWGDAWSPRKFYATMHCVGRVPDGQPFFLASERFGEPQYSGSASLYARARVEDYLYRYWARGRSQAATDVGRTRAVRAPNPWPDPLPGEPEYVITPGQVALGRMNFAKSRRAQAAARREVKALSASGSRARRQALANARKAMPQVKAMFDVRDMTEKIVPYHAKRQFMWNFLRHELHAALRHAALISKETPITLKELRRDQHGVIEDLAQETVDKLLKAYAFLGLSSQDLLAGLRSSHPADRDTAARYTDPDRGIRLSPKSVRSLLTRPH